MEALLVISVVYLSSLCYKDELELPCNIFKFFARSNSVTEKIQEGAGLGVLVWIAEVVEVAKVAGIAKRTGKGVVAKVTAWILHIKKKSTLLKIWCCRSIRTDSIIAYN